MRPNDDGEADEEENLCFTASELSPRPSFIRAIFSPASVPMLVALPSRKAEVSGSDDGKIVDRGS